ncbi:hypothetical protein ENUP19_0047G0178 [Entamoeba nuttalli]|uniref:Uncharacterized protein n=2 Tax=Entamoeba nuttalli TaxID=412467 RepID=K2H1N2_ENTNP|nr:hypothetical protein ENU1_100970 [Entamoeba nuttalli P19]EKE40137.1 hypothetical protein ENU1_100970 [Entamoeba nuttalli P19]|eukprot:XP_008857529.1 hypothetical protein ENU1_100970 [Entamoeba nuttalli P19]
MIWKLLFLLFFIYYESYAEDVTPHSLCIGNVLVAPISLKEQFTGDPIQITQECYKGEVDNYESVVFGHQIHSECYIEESFMFFSLSNTNYSRCGSCVELTGPGLKPITCMITGSFNVQTTSSSNLKTKGMLKRTKVPSTSMFKGKLSLLVSRVVFNEIIPSEMTDSLYYYEVALRETVCNYNVLPQLVLRNKTNAIIINAGHIILGLGRSNDLRLPNRDGSFTISHTKELRATNIYQSIIYWESISIDKTNYQKPQPAFSRFSSPNITSHCVSIPTKNVFQSLVDQKNTQVFWEVSLGTTTNDLKVITSIGNKTVEDNEQLVFHFDYPVPIQWKTIIQHFALVISSTDTISFKSGKVYFKQGAIDEINCDSFRYLIQNKTISSGIYKYSFNVHASFITSTCNGFANGLEFIISAAKGTIIQYDEVYYEPQTSEIVTPSSFCSYDSFQCGKYQCTLSEKILQLNNNTHSIFETPSCIPYCGTCQVGYSCTEEGICQRNK